MGKSNQREENEAGARRINVKHGSAKDGLELDVLLSEWERHPEKQTMGNTEGNTDASAGTSGNRERKAWGFQRRTVESLRGSGPTGQ